jgi:hypothetical protein
MPSHNVAPTMILIPVPGVASAQCRPERGRCPGRRFIAKSGLGGYEPERCSKLSA